MSRLLQLLILGGLFAAMLLGGCGPRMRTLPVGEGNVQIHSSLGGPVISLRGRTIPIPYGMAGVTYGLSDRVDLYSDVHVASAVFKTLGWTPGVAWFPNTGRSSWQPGLGANLLVFSDFHEHRVFPQVITSLAVRDNPHAAPYAGMIHTLQANHKPEYIPSLFAGISFPGKRTRLVFEVQALALNFRRDEDAPDYMTFHQHGALSFQVGYSIQIAGGGDE
jgi:hypothetical protein